MKAVLLLSGGIDSPVAGYLTREKLDLIPVYFDNSPYSDKSNEKRAIRAAKKLGFKKLTVVPHGPNLFEFSRKCEPKYTCVLCKRMMYRLAEKIAKKHGAKALVTGDNLAQVASQTSWNLFVLTEASKLPVLRPLIGFDKNEIIAISRKTKLYDISTSSAMCCSIVPRKPSTKSELGRIKSEEKKVNIAKLVKESIEGAREIKC
jgi:thiamine biosynthesis protein ThiI